MRTEILKCLGKFPLSSELNLKYLAEDDMGTYTRKLVEYNVEENEKVRAYLLIPKDINKKMPGILAVHQHASNYEIGKSEVVGLTKNDMYSYGLDLVKRGYVVIAPDLLCFEERMGSPKFRENKDMQKLYEKYEFCKRVLEGSSLQTKYLHDLKVAVDLLRGLEFVDTDNIGVIGHSLGGQESIWALWFDSRIKAGVSSCGVSLIKDIEENEIVHNFALYVPNLLNVCDMDDIIKEIVETRHLLITSGTQDEYHFPISGIEKIEKLNKDNPNFVSIRFNDGHKFNDEEKRRAYEFLDSVLKK